MLHVLEAKPKVGYSLGRASSGQDSRYLERFHQRKVKEVQSAPVALYETTSVSDAVVALFLENVGSLTVVDAQGYLAGIVSRKDLLKVTLGNQGAAAIPISLVMTRHPNVVTVTPECTVVEAARKLITHQVDSLPVVRDADTQGSGSRLEVVGRISKTTMTLLLLELATGKTPEAL
ncbi:transcriptional regulator [Paenibacillus nasutitermitis]|uniref:Transcriptional regulator n=2 Tax=Paenibacillus nasutitermitis TaxID=1652958 RepID=A0A917DKV5_9BACL|nr:transcriptional regulator [Paenibacillus nasutitermitis]